MLQASQHETPVWHSIIALGSLHEHFEKGTPVLFIRQGLDTFAIQQYVAAIKLISRPFEPSAWCKPRVATTSHSLELTVDVCLLLCILFACFEILSGHYVSAISHIRSGFKILGEIYYDPFLGTYRHAFLKPSAGTTLDMEHLRKTLNRLQSQTLTLTRAGTDESLVNSAYVGPAHSFEMPESFASLEEARDILEYHSRNSLHTFREMTEMQPVSNVFEKRALFYQYSKSLVDKWSTALNNFEQRRGQSISAKELTALQILRMHRNKQVILLGYSTSDRTDRMTWDKYNSLFEEIVTLADGVISSTSGMDSPTSPSPAPLSSSLSRQTSITPSFSLDLGVIEPLYDVVTLCRDPSTRRRAVNLLHLASRHEGVYNSSVCAVVGEMVIAIEEQLAANSSEPTPSDLAALCATVSCTFQPQGPRDCYNHHHGIRRSDEIPDAARLSLAHPTFDLVNKKVFLTVSGAGGAHNNILLPAITDLLEADE